MKKALLLFFCVTFFTNAFADAQTITPEAQRGADKALKVVVPFMGDAPGQGPEHPLVDVIRQWSEETGRDISIERFPFKRGLMMAGSGEIDFHFPLIKDHDDTDTALPFGYSSSTIFTINFVLYTRRGESLDMDNLQNYRQRTLTYLGIGALGDGLVSEETMAKANETAYQDVRNAFEHYLNNDSNGRGFILVGHSQGARLLSRLLQEEIEGNDALSQRLVAAHLIGTGISVPVGEQVGGTFQQTPLCTTANQAGCVVAYSTFRKGDPELETPRFGVVPETGYEAACTHPAALAGGVETLQARLPFDQPYAFDVLLEMKGSSGPYKSWWKSVRAKREADFYAVPGQFSGQCVRDAEGTHYLEVTIDTDPEDPRADEYRGELIVVKGWGLHLMDVNIAQGDLIRLAGDQINAWGQR